MEKKDRKKISFKEILSLGVDMGDRNLMFGDFIYIAVDQGRNLYVLDSKNHWILKFDKTGKFLWKAGREGQGAG